MAATLEDRVFVNGSTVYVDFRPSARRTVANALRNRPDFDDESFSCLVIVNHPNKRKEWVSLFEHGTALELQSEHDWKQLPRYRIGVVACQDVRRPISKKDKRPRAEEKRPLAEVEKGSCNLSLEEKDRYMQKWWDLMLPLPSRRRAAARTEDNELHPSVTDTTLPLATREALRSHKFRYVVLDEAHTCLLSDHAHDLQTLQRDASLVLTALPIVSHPLDDLSALLQFVQPDVQWTPVLRRLLHPDRSEPLSHSAEWALLHEGLFVFEDRTDRLPDRVASRDFTSRVQVVVLSETQGETVRRRLDKWRIENDRESLELRKAVRACCTVEERASSVMQRANAECRSRNSLLPAPTTVLVKTFPAQEKEEKEPLVPRREADSLLLGEGEVTHVVHVGPPTWLRPDLETALALQRDVQVTYVVDGGFTRHLLHAVFHRQSATSWWLHTLRPSWDASARDARWTDKDRHQLALWDRALLVPAETWRTFPVYDTLPSFPAGDATALTQWAKTALGRTRNRDYDLLSRYYAYQCDMPLSQWIEAHGQAAARDFRRLTALFVYMTPAMAARAGRELEADLARSGGFPAYPVVLRSEAQWVLRLVHLALADFSLDRFVTVARRVLHDLTRVEAYHEAEAGEHPLAAASEPSPFLLQSLAVPAPSVGAVPSSTTVVPSISVVVPSSAPAVSITLPAPLSSTIAVTSSASTVVVSSASSSSAASSSAASSSATLVSSSSATLVSLTSAASSSATLVSSSSAASSSATLVSSSSTGAGSTVALLVAPLAEEKEEEDVILIDRPAHFGKGRDITLKRKRVAMQKASPPAESRPKAVSSQLLSQRSHYREYAVPAAKAAEWLRAAAAAVPVGRGTLTTGRLTTLRIDEPSLADLARDFRWTIGLERGLERWSFHFVSVPATARAPVTASLLVPDKHFHVLLLLTPAEEPLPSITLLSADGGSRTFDQIRVGSSVALVGPCEVVWTSHTSSSSSNRDQLYLDVQYISNTV